MNSEIVLLFNKLSSHHHIFCMFMHSNVIIECFKVWSHQSKGS
jgi:hypothetical protein